MERGGGGGGGGDGLGLTFSMDAVVGGGGVVGGGLDAGGESSVIGNITEEDFNNI